ncbi:MAG: glycosyltransferase family 39 protein [Leptolyngbya sp. SIO1D8]|nr:glycosyltransferase family 39 protein [Leptolyngbya sp. SIO1D8]
MYFFKVTKTYSRWKAPFLIPIFFAVLSLLTRFPFFFKDVTEWDESTFILLGQSFLNGNLPYTDIWDLKPPFVSVAFALFIFVFGKSIASIRLAGTICVALIAWFVYLTGKATWTPRAGLLGGTLFILLIALFRGGQPTMTEQVALVPLMGAVALTVNSKLTQRCLFWVSLLMATASMIRLNLAYTSLTAGLAVVLAPSFKNHSWERGLQSAIARGLTFATGSLLILFLTLLPYLITGQFQIWWQSVILAPLSYASLRFSWIEVAQIHFQTLGWMIFDENNVFTLARPLSLSIISILVWGGALIGMGVIVAQWRKIHVWERRNIILLFFFFAGTLYSILKGGAAHPHYLIQIIPFVTICAGIGLGFLSSKACSWQVAIMIVSIIFLGSRPALTGYQNIQSRIASGKELDHGSAYEIAEYIKQAGSAEKSVYLMVDHIAYWFLEKQPLSRVTTHPSNISKEYLLEFVEGSETTTEIELARVLEKEPDFIVTTRDIGYLDSQQSAKTLLEKTLEEDYRLVKEVQHRVENRQIYKKK